MSLNDAINQEDEIRQNLKCEYILEMNNFKMRRKEKSALMFNCPFCNSGKGKKGTPGFAVILKTNRFYCHACESSGSVFDLIGELYDLTSWSDKKKKALELYTGRIDFAPSSTGIDIKQPTIEEKPSENYVKKYIDFMQILNRCPDAIAYLKNRGILPETATHFMLGYDDYTKRIVIPITSTYYLRRDITGNAECKYLDKGTGKANAIFNVKALKKATPGTIVFITEGAFDSMILYQMNELSIAINSVSMTNNIKRLLEREDIASKRFQFVVAMDNDADNENNPGEKASERLKQILTDKVYNFYKLQSKPNEDITDVYLNDREYLINQINQIKEQIMKGQKNNE